MATNTFYPTGRQPVPDNPDDLPKASPVPPISPAIPTLPPDLLAKYQPLNTEAQPHDLASGTDKANSEIPAPIEIPRILQPIQPDQTQRLTGDVAQRESAAFLDPLGSGFGNIALPPGHFVRYQPASPEPNLKHVDQIVDRVVKQLIVILLLILLAAGSWAFAFFSLRKYPLDQYKQAWDELVNE